MRPTTPMTRAIQANIAPITGTMAVKITTRAARMPRTMAIRFIFLLCAVPPQAAPAVGARRQPGVVGPHQQTRCPSRVASRLFVQRILDDGAQPNLLRLVTASPLIQCGV